MKLYKTPGIFKKIYPDFFWSIPSKNAIYLTFDDGPTPKVTEWVLSELKKFNAQATFFCIGKNVKENPSLYQNILSAGHSVGNHTFHHLKGRNTDTKSYLLDINKTKILINSNLFRPPYGSIKPRQSKQLKPEMKIIMWDVLSYDWEKDFDVEKAYQKVVQATQPGSIVVFHDSLKADKNLKILLPKLLSYWQEKGFEFRGIAN